MRKTSRNITVIIAIFASMAPSALAREVVLNNGSARLVIESEGGAIVSFTTADNDYNPFTWGLTRDAMPKNNRKGAPFRGHFLCLGRWGDPTPGEVAAGIPNNGDISTMDWDVEKSADGRAAWFSAASDLDAMSFEREVQLSDNTTAFRVVERVKNISTLCRPFNIVQHATFGPPFLDESTIIDTNAGDGFMQHLCYPAPSDYAYTWPVGVADSIGTKIDLRSSREQFSYVTTHLMPDSIGWVTAATPDCGLLLGYIWDAAEYPWLNVWHQRVDGELWAKGLEFGTTGVGKPYDMLVATDTSFRGKNSFFILDALQTVKKSYICFLMPIPEDFEGVESISLSDGVITVKPIGSESDITIRL